MRRRSRKSQRQKQAIKLLQSAAAQNHSYERIQWVNSITAVELQNDWNSSFFKKLPEAAGRDTARQSDNSREPSDTTMTSHASAGTAVRVAPPPDSPAPAPHDTATSPRRRIPQRRRQPPTKTSRLRSMKRYHSPETFAEHPYRHYLEQFIDVVI